MTQAEIESLLAAILAHHQVTGDDNDLPGLITFQRDDWVGADLPCVCTSPARGIRYRGLQVKISKERESRVWTRGEALAQGEDPESFEALKSLEDARV